jgi:hypothetical protein
VGEYCCQRHVIIKQLASEKNELYDEIASLKAKVEKLNSTHSAEQQTKFTICPVTAISCTHAKTQVACQLESGSCHHLEQEKQ